MESTFDSHIFHIQIFISQFTEPKLLQPNNSDSLTSITKLMFSIRSFLRSTPIIIFSDLLFLTSNYRRLQSHSLCFSTQASITSQATRNIPLPPLTRAIKPSQEIQYVKVSFHLLRRFIFTTPTRKNIIQVFSTSSSTTTRITVWILVVAS